MFDVHRAQVAMRHPIPRRRYAMRPETLLFRSPGAVLRYNVMRRLFGAISFRILGIPTLSFVDDFGAPTRASIIEEAAFSFKIAADSIAMLHKDTETDVGNKIIYSGMAGHFPGPDAGRCLIIPLSSGWAQLIVFTLSVPIRIRSIAHNSTVRLIGKLGFASTSLYNRFPRATIHPLYRKLYSDPYFPSFQGKTSRARTWLWIALQAIPRRSIPTRPNDINCAKYIYVSDMPELRIGCLWTVIFDRRRIPAPDGPILEIQFESIATDYLLSLCGDASAIFGLELTAARWEAVSLWGRLRGGGGPRLYLSVITRFFVRLRDPPPTSRPITMLYWNFGGLWLFSIYEFGPGESIVSIIHPITPLAFRLLDSPVSEPGPFSGDESRYTLAPTWWIHSVSTVSLPLLNWACVGSILMDNSFSIICITIPRFRCDR